MPTHEVIVMEDNRIHLQEINDVLEELNCKVKAVDNKDDAISLANTHEAPLYILDVKVERTPTFRQDILEKIAPKMLNHKLKFIKEQENETRDLIDKLDKIKNNTNDNDIERNIRAYEIHLDNQAWFEQYKCKYVAFVDGEFVDSDESEKDLLQRLQQDYPCKTRFFKKVQKGNIIVDIPCYDVISFFVLDN